MVEPVPVVEPVETLVAEVRDRLAGAADPEKAAAMQAYMKSAMPYHGVTAPAPEAGAAAVLRGVPPGRPRRRGRPTVRALWDDATYREERYAATRSPGTGQPARGRTPAALDLYRHLVVTGAWWDHVDEVASRLVGRLLAGPRPGPPVSLAWAQDDDLWLRRTAVPEPAAEQGPTDVDLLREVLEANPRTARPGVLDPQGRGLGPPRARARPTRTGSVLSWTSTRTGSPRSPDARPSSTSAGDALDQSHRVVRRTALGVVVEVHEDVGALGPAPDDRGPAIEGPVVVAAGVELGVTVQAA